MPYDSNGGHTPTPGYKAVTGQKVLPSNHNPPIEDFNASLGMVYVKDGRAPMTGPVNMNGNPITDLVDGVGPQDAATVGQAASAIGDFKDSVRDLGEKWLRRNGDLYDKDDYPELADLLPTLEDGLVFEVADTGTINSINGVAQGEGKYVAVGGNGWVGVSTDRLSWAPKDSTVTDGFFSVTYGAGIFLGGTGAGQIVASPDGETWSATTVSTMSIIRRVIHDGTNFILVGQTLSAEPRVAYSVDGASWALSSPPGTDLYVSIAASPSRGVIVGAGGKIASSDNHGQTWTARTSGTTQPLNAVHWDATTNIFIAVGNNGVILTSADGAAWSLRSSGTSGNFAGVGSNVRGIVAVGSNLVRLSDNGTQWNPVLTTGGFSGIIGDTVVPNHYIITGGGGYIADAARTAPTQFRVPNDDPDYGWIKALA